MERFKKICMWLLFPPIVLLWLLVPASAAMLIYAFVAEGVHPIVVYGSYFLSAYALTLVCVRSPAIFKKLRAVKRQNRYISRYESDPILRVKLSLYASFLINVAYAMLQFFSGIYYQFVWFFALCGYYLLLAVMRFFLLRDAVKGTLGVNQLSEWKRYGFCGIFLLLVNLALGVIVTYIVWQNRGFEYNEILTIAMAAYTFFSMAKAVLNVYRYRRYNSPVMSAARAISFAAALVSMLSLETAMLSAFGGENTDKFRQIMTAATGAGVCLAVLSMAIYMIVRSAKERNNFKIGVGINE